MIRVLLGSALPILGLALAAGFAGPDLVTGLSGAPMIVTGSDRVDLAATRFDGEACASTLLYGETPRAGERPGLRLVAMALRPDGQDIELGIREIPGAAGAPIATVTLLFDETGHLVAISKPVQLQPAAAPRGDCATAPKPSREAPI